MERKQKIDAQACETENLTWYGGKGRSGRSGSDVRMLINETAAVVDFVMNNQVQILLSGLRAVNFGKCSRGGRRKAEGGGWKAGGGRAKGKRTFLELCDDTSAYVNSFVSDIVEREDEERIGGLVMERKEKKSCRSDLSALVYFHTISDVWVLILTNKN